LEVPRVKIEQYGFGRIVIDGQAYRADLIVLPDRVIEDWWRMEGHRLNPEDLDDVFEARPDCLVVGTGAMGMMKVPDETAAAIEARGIRLVVHRTAKAVKSFDKLRETGRVVGAFHLTC
jgi:hypothetical protein